MREPRIRLPEPPHPEERRAATRLEGWAATARPACPHGSRRRASQPTPAQLRKRVCPGRLLSTRTIESEARTRRGAGGEAILAKRTQVAKAQHGQPSADGW